MSDEIFISTDVETDGPIPGPYSMLSLGAAAFVLPNKEPISTFSVNFETLDGAEGDPETLEWWKGQPEAWAACRKDQEKPAEAIRRYVSWVESLPGIEKKPTPNGVGLWAVSNAVFVGYPAGFDFTFVYWYIRRFGARSPFSFSALDMKTFAMASLGTTFRDAVRKNMPKEWFPEHPLSHLAVEDAVDQGIAFVNMVLHARGQSK